MADDKKEALIIRNTSDTMKLQEEIDRFVQWCDENGLELNIKKCKIMTLRNPIIPHYNIKGTVIQRVEQMSDLGVTMDPKLSFALHREFVKKNANNNPGFVKRECYKTLSMDNAKLLYGSLVRSHLEFENVIWSPYASSQKE